MSAISGSDTSNRRSSLAARNRRASIPSALTAISPAVIGGDIPREKTTKSKNSQTLGTSAYRDYYLKLVESSSSSWFGTAKGNSRFDPTVVQTEAEFNRMLADVATRCSMTVKSVHLPPDMNMNDPRLRGTPHPIISITAKVLPPGQMPDLPQGPYISDVAKSIMAPEWTPNSVKGEAVRVQVIPPALLPLSLSNGEFALNRGKSDCLNFEVQPLKFSPREVPEESVSHHKVAEMVHAEEHRMYRARSRF